MPHVVYQLSEGVFCTTDQPFTDAHLAAFAVTDAQAALIAAGAQLSVVDGALVFEALPDAAGEVEVAVIEPIPELIPDPVEGE